MMRTFVDAVLGGEPFQTGTGVATVLGRKRVSADREEDGLLLKVVSPNPRLGTYQAYTTMLALADALEAKRWTPVATGTPTGKGAPPATPIAARPAASNARRAAPSAPPILGL